jgi:DNA-binding NarL/FixJ family response regulator
MEKFFACVGDDLLTNQELALLNLAAQGLSNGRIGQALGFSEKTVRNYLTQVYRKLDIDAGAGVNPRIAAINKARELGLLHEEA